MQYLFQSSWPPTLQQFLHQSQAFSIDRAASTDITPVILSKQTCRGMTPKKQHEVSRLAALVAQTCQQAGCQVVVDVGAGLVCMESSALNICQQGMSPWWPLLGLLYWCFILMSSFCNSFEDGAVVDEIYGCPIFK